MFTNMPKITFFVRSNNNKAQTHSLYCRIVLNGRAKELSTGEEINPDNWDQEAQTFTGSTAEQSDYINLLCTRIKYKLKMLAMTLKKDNETLCPGEVFEAYRNPGVIKNTIIFEVIEKYISWEKTETELNAKTIAIHERYLKHIKEFAKRKNYFVTDLTEVEAEKFKDWFRTSRETKNKGSASRHISYFKNALTWAVKKGIIKAHNLLYYEGERDKVKKPVPISENDILTLIRFQFKSPMLNNIKDLFLFQIATGISYGDLWSDFEVQNTTAGKIIVGKRNKGIGNSFFVPYEPIADALLMKYNYRLPKYCNGTYNRLLKEVSALVGIEKKLNTHIGRKTFATSKISEGWTLYNVSLMLGHSSIKTTETYYVEKNSGSLVTEMSLRNNQTQQQLYI